VTRPSFDCYVGVRPACGCMTAWISVTNSTAEELGEFFRWMRATHRDVLSANTKDVRERLDTCPHVDPWTEHDCEVVV